MDKATAAQVSRLTGHAIGYLNDAIAVVRAGGDQEEFERFRRTVGQIMGAIVIDVQPPLYAEHPDIVPPELK